MDSCQCMHNLPSRSKCCTQLLHTTCKRPTWAAQVSRLTFEGISLVREGGGRDCTVRYMYHSMKVSCLMSVHFQQHCNQCHTETLHWAVTWFGFLTVSLTTITSLHSHFAPRQSAVLSTRACQPRPPPEIPHRERSTSCVIASSTCKAAALCISGSICCSQTGWPETSNRHHYYTPLQAPLAARLTLRLG